ncbi:MAG TPA: hypothetical protein K8V27_05825 [Butyricicoccus pullicaecorum]|mgnify:FL=1|nr:hypothetical protein [Butyricicoccus pullicaecorum]
MKNQDIRAEVKSAGLHLWQIAEAYGLTDSSFSRKLRHELPDEEKTLIRAIITQLSVKGGDCA